MKLLRCHIDNFGKLTDYTVDFTENPQVFYAPNGWGKSTLAAFIKVMFYGFAGEGKRGATLEKERLRYKPWQGGVYGGEIIFEAGGKTYLVNRTFGSKEAEDTFALYDNVTGLKSEDYTVNIGEELFQINRESFLRTVFLGQNDSDTFATDSINAKIGNLADNLDDMNNYEKVQQVLKDLRNNMSPSRKTGSLKKQKDLVAELTDELRKAGAIEAAMAEIEEKLTDCQQEKVRLGGEKEVLQKKWEALTERKALEAKKAHYDSIVGQRREKQYLAEELLESMGGSAPAKEAFAAAQEQYRFVQEQESEAKAYALEEQECRELERLQQCFRNGVPADEQLKAGREQLKQLEELRIQAAGKCLDENEMAEKERLEELFGVDSDNGQTLTERLEFLEQNLEDGIRSVGAYMEQKSGLGAQRATLRSLKLLKEQERLQREQNIQKLEGEKQTLYHARRGAVWLLIVGAALLAAGGILAGILHRQMGLWLLGAGGIGALTGAAWLLIGRGKIKALSGEIMIAIHQAEGTEEDVAALEEEIFRAEEYMASDRAFVASVLSDAEGCAQEAWDTDEAWENPLYLRDVLYDHKDELKRLRRLCAREADYKAAGYESRMLELEKQVAAVIEPFYGETSADALNGCLARLAEEKERLGALTEQQKRWATAQDAARQNRQKVLDYLTKYGQTENDLYRGLQNLADSMNTYDKTLSECRQLQEEQADFEHNNDVNAFAKLLTEAPESEELIKNLMQQTEDALLQTDEQIHGYRRQLEDRRAEYEELMLQREKLKQAQANLTKDMEYYTRIGLVSTYLERAKESLSAKYIGPVQESFKRHYELLAGESAEDFRMDAHLQVSKRAMGELRETGAFSAGNRDLIAIVLRVALVEAMYQQEKPFLILDDSFVNLDGERLKTAGQFMRQIAKEYQVIYFTCHESRVWTE